MQDRAGVRVIQDKTETTLGDQVGQFAQRYKLLYDI